MLQYTLCKCIGKEEMKNVISLHINNQNLHYTSYNVSDFLNRVPRQILLWNILIT